MKRRIKNEGGWGVYHCVSRVVWQEFVLDDSCKEVFARMMRKVAEFCGVEVLTFCLMTNHVHLLVRVPYMLDGSGKVKELSDEELVRRVRVLYGKGSRRAKEVEKHLKDKGMREAVRKDLLGRMHEVSVYMKELKQRYSIWFNGRYGKKGTMWSERFRSVLVEEEGGECAVRMMAGYIDLNAVRAGMVKEAGEYRWCGYGEAVRGVKAARRGLSWVMGLEGWKETVSVYDELLGSGMRRERGKEGGREEEKEEGEGLIGLLGRRVRYFTDGGVLGRKGYVEGWMKRHVGEYFPKRSAEVRGAKGLKEYGITVLRELRKDVLGEQVKG